MTKKELTLGTHTAVWNCSQNKSFSLLEKIEKTALVVRLSHIYSHLLEEQVSARRTLKLVHAQVAVLMLLVLGGASVVMALFLCLWTVLAVWQCRENEH